MNIRDLKVGDKVFIREDLEYCKCYGKRTFDSKMLNGVQKIFMIDYDNQTFEIEAEKNKQWFLRFDYTPEMIDWEKTMNLKDIQAKEYLNKKFGSDTVHNPSHYGGGGIHNIECYKAIEYILDNLENVPEKYYGHVSNIVKYIWRCNDKNGYEDLDKASVYFDFMFRED
jgi:hypothetical protein